MPHLPALQALIFDVDGTMADTEEAHRRAFNLAFQQMDMPWHWDRGLYRELLGISGGKERIRHHWQQVQGDMKPLDGTAMDDTIDQLHALKTAAYERLVQDGLVQLRPGVQHLIEAAGEARLRLAIATTTSPVNIAALLRLALGPGWAQHFQVIEDASTAPRKKPHPQVYLQTLKHLGLPPNAALAFEDSANGLQAAHAAGLATIVTPNAYTAHHAFDHAARTVPDLRGVDIPMLRHWHARAHAPAPAHAAR
jgi:HAD superfamily hydrolase (TIGR01509 family)